MWRARYRDDQGRERARHFARKIDAQRWLDETTAMLVTGVYADPQRGKVTFTAWFQAWAGRQLWAPASVNVADSALKSVPFGDVPLGKLRTSHIQEWVRGGADLSPATVRLRYGFVRRALKAAVQERVIPFDPSDSVTLPRPARRDHAMKLPTPYELRSIIDAADAPFRAFIQVGAYAGLRLSEISGLQVADVDFLRGTINVERQMQGRNVSELRPVPPKHDSHRVVYVPRSLTDAIASHLAVYGALGAERWVFHTEGHCFTVGGVGVHWRRATAAAGTPAYRFHSTRHYFASALIASGCDVVTVQRALGHSSASITLGTYSHLWPSAEDRTRAAAEALMAATESATADCVRTTDQERGIDQR